MSAVDDAGALLAAHPVAEDRELRGARFDAGLAFVHFDAGHGGRGGDISEHADVEEVFSAAGAADWSARNVIGLGMAAPTIHAHGTEAQKQRHLRPLFTGEEIWCQLFSEPGAGSDLASVTSRATRVDGGWQVSGQKVWTTLAHVARWGLLLARTDPDQPKHRGLTYFILDMTSPGIEVRPLRQLTGEAEFNEVYLDDVPIPDEAVVGEVNGGWAVALTTLMNERVSIGGTALPREGGMIGPAARNWREHPERRTPGLHDRMLRLWADAEVARLASARFRQSLAAGQPGPEGSAAKIVFARLNQEISAFEVELSGTDGLRYDDWTMRRSGAVDFYGRNVGYRYLRSRGNSIEGGTSEILRNIIAERVLGLPTEPRADTKIPWKDLPR